MWLAGCHGHSWPSQGRACRSCKPLRREIPSRRPQLTTMPYPAALQHSKQTHPQSLIQLGSIDIPTASSRGGTSTTRSSSSVHACKVLEWVSSEEHDVYLDWSGCVVCGCVCAVLVERTEVIEREPSKSIGSAARG